MNNQNYQHVNGQYNGQQQQYYPHSQPNYNPQPVPGTPIFDPVPQSTPRGPTQLQQQFQPSQSQYQMPPQHQQPQPQFHPPPFHLQKQNSQPTNQPQLSQFQSIPNFQSQQYHNQPKNQNQYTQPDQNVSQYPQYSSHSGESFGAHQPQYQQPTNFPDAENMRKIVAARIAQNQLEKQRQEEERQRQQRNKEYLESQLKEQRQKEIELNTRQLKEEQERQARLLMQQQQIQRQKMPQAPPQNQFQEFNQIDLQNEDQEMQKIMYEQFQEERRIREELIKNEKQNVNKNQPIFNEPVNTDKDLEQACTNLNQILRNNPHKISQKIDLETDIQKIRDLDQLAQMKADNQLFYLCKLSLDLKNLLLRQKEFLKKTLDEIEKEQAFVAEEQLKDDMEIAAKLQLEEIQAEEEQKQPDFLTQEIEELKALLKKLDSLINDCKLDWNCEQLAAPALDIISQFNRIFKAAPQQVQQASAFEDQDPNVVPVDAHNQEERLKALLTPEVLQKMEQKNTDPFKDPHDANELVFPLYNRKNSIVLSYTKDNSQLRIVKKESSKTIDDFSLKFVKSVYTAGQYQICEACVKQDNSKGFKIGPSFRFNLCATCTSKNQNLYLKRTAEGQNILVDEANDNGPKQFQIEQKQEKVQTFCLLENLIATQSSVNQLRTDSIEFQFVQHCFQSTFGSPVNLVKIDKISNNSVQMRFNTELKLVRDKNPQKPLSEILRFLFHGTRANAPLPIVQSETGLDMRHANPGGAFGAGIYFADNSLYSNSYKYTEGGQHQMLFCYVIVGDSLRQASQPGQKMAPQRADGKPYDSVNNGNHYIIYDNNKQYPCYLITYQ